MGLSLKLGVGVDQMINELIKREGGLVDHPADRGGPTKYGITQKTLDAWLAAHPGWVKPGGHLNIKDINHSQAALIYEKTYYRDPKIDQLPEPWQPLVFDWAVNSGPATAIKALQELCLGAGLDPGPIDGIIGPKTVAAARRLLTFPLLSYLAKRRDFCEAICENDPGQQVFLRGWLNRIDGLEKGLT